MRRHKLMTLSFLQTKVVSRGLKKKESFSRMSSNIPMKQKRLLLGSMTFCQKNNSLGFSGDMHLVYKGCKLTKI
jgi:hypothetical protein